jgi:uncharacterized membrane protein
MKSLGFWMAALLLGGAGAALRSVEPAQAQRLRQICNRAGESVNISVGYENGVSRGWWTIKNGNCLTLESHPVHGYITHYYANSVRSDNRSRWYGDGSRQFCIEPDNAFEIRSRNGCLGSTQLRPFGFVGSGINLRP